MNVLSKWGIAASAKASRPDDLPKPAAPDARILASMNTVAMNHGLDRRVGAALQDQFGSDEPGAASYVREVCELCAIAGAPGPKAEEFISAGKSIDDVRAELRAARPKTQAPDARRSTPPGAQIEIGEDWDAPPAIVAKFGDAMLCAHADHKPTIGREFAGLKGVELMRAFLVESGIRNAALWSSSRVIASAFGEHRYFANTGAGLQTTSDYPAVLEWAANRSVNQGFEDYMPALFRVSRQRSASDFRDVRSVYVSGGAELEQTNEAGEFKSGSLTESAETFPLLTWGKIYSLSRQLIVNDTDSILTDQRRLGRGGALAMSKHLVSILEANSGNGQNMADGNPVFDASRGNKAGTGAGLSLTTLSEGRTAMRRQVDENGNPISPAPRFLIVPPELETTAEQLLTDIDAATTTDVNVFSGSLELVVEPLLASTTRWYLVADPSMGDGLQHAFLNGQGAIEVFIQDGFEIDGTKIKLRADFGAGFAEARTWWMNDGA